MGQDKGEKKMICISCPLGCRMTVTRKNDEVTVEGNACSRGEIYGREEMLAPKRVVTATVEIKGFLLKRIPVKTDAPLGKEHIPMLLDELYRMEISRPVKRNELIIKNYLGTEVNVVASRSVPGKPEMKEEQANGS